MAYFRTDGAVRGACTRAEPAFVFTLTKDVLMVRSTLSVFALSAFVTGSLLMAPPKPRRKPSRSGTGSRSS